MEADQVGTFYGQCNQICGQDHSRMPISVKAVSEADFKTWIEAGEKVRVGSGPTQDRIEVMWLETVPARRIAGLAAGESVERLRCLRFLTPTAMTTLMVTLMTMTISPAS